MAEALHSGGACVLVVYALPDVQHLVEVECTPGMTASDAVERSGLLETLPEIAARPLVLGLFGRAIEPSVPIRPGDRIEICRPLLRDPREQRRLMSDQGMVIGQRRAAQSSQRSPDDGQRSDSS